MRLQAFPMIRTHAGHAMPVDTMPPLSERERVGLQLRSARKDASLSTAQAAERGDISVTQLGAIERGQHSLTSMAAGNLSRLPAAFGLTWERFAAILAPVYGPYMPWLYQPAPATAPAALGVYVPAPLVSTPDDTRTADLFLVRHGDERPGTRAYTADDMSMAPVILPGGVVLVDSDDRTPRPGEVVAAQVGGQVVLRRVRVLGGVAWLIADDAAVEAIPAAGAGILGTVYLVQNPPARPTLN